MCVETSFFVYLFFRFVIKAAVFVFLSMYVFIYACMFLCMQMYAYAYNIHNYIHVMFSVFVHTFYYAYKKIFMLIA